MTQACVCSHIEPDSLALPDIIVISPYWGVVAISFVLVTILPHDRPESPLLLLTFLFWAVSLHRLMIYPSVCNDPWMASANRILAKERVIGPKLFAGIYAAEGHLTDYTPLHPYHLANASRVGGLGLFQVRFEPLLSGLLTIARRFSPGQRLFRQEPARQLVVWLTDGLDPLRRISS